MSGRSGLPEVSPDTRGWFEMDEKLSGGHLLSAISNSIVRILRERYGRGPMKAKTYALDDIIVVVLRAGGFTAAEQTMIDSGEPERVVA